MINLEGGQLQVRGCLRRLNNLLKKDIIKSQLQEGIAKIAPEIADESKEFYLLHKPVYREDAETNKVRVVYGASYKATKGFPSLIDCLETGPKLQHLLWDILVRNQFKPICLCVDIQKVFLQIRIRDKELLASFGLEIYKKKELKSSDLHDQLLG